MGKNRKRKKRWAREEDVVLLNRKQRNRENCNCFLAAKNVYTIPDYSVPFTLKYEW